MGVQIGSVNSLGLLVLVALAKLSKQRKPSRVRLLAVTI